MAEPSTSPFPVPPPSASEVAALSVAAAYFARAGTQAASRLLDGSDGSASAALLGALRDNLLAGAALCDGVLDLAAERPGSG